MDNEKIKSLMEDLISTVNKMYDIRQKIYKETGYFEELFDFFNDVADGTYDTADEAMKALEETHKERELDKEEVEKEL